MQKALHVHLLLHLEQMSASIWASFGQNHQQNAPLSLAALEDHLASLEVAVALSEVLVRLLILPCTAVHLQTRLLRQRSCHHLRPMKSP